MASSSFKLKLEGVRDVRRRLAQAGPAYTRAMGAALHREGLRIMAESVPLVPVEFGRLRASHYTAPPKTEGGDISVEIGYGTDYAVYVHERTELHHDVGQAKYLEEPVNEARNGYAERLAADVRRMVRMGLGFGSAR